MDIFNSVQHFVYNKTFLEIATIEIIDTAFFERRSEMDNWLLEFKIACIVTTVVFVGLLVLGAVLC